MFAWMFFFCMKKDLGLVTLPQSPVMWKIQEVVGAGSNDHYLPDIPAAALMLP